MNHQQAQEMKGGADVDEQVARQVEQQRHPAGTAVIMRRRRARRRLGNLEPAKF